MALLPGVKSWAPFQIDALGIVTLLGADNIRKATARLVSNPYVEYFPLLASHIFADNSIADNLPGFTLYNISDGIKATDLSSWFTHWLACQRLGWQETTLHVRIRQTPWRPGPSWFFSILISGLLNAFIIVFPIILGDWYGFASSLGLVATILVRSYILHECRASLDRLVLQGTEESSDPVKLFITLPNGRVVSAHTTRGITVKALLTEAEPQNRRMHSLARAVNWIAFAVHAITLGMASLCTQLILVITELSASIIVVQRFGCDESRLGRYLEIEQVDDESINTRTKAYLKLKLDEKGEESMIKWDLFPVQSNELWWQRYRALQAVPEPTPDSKPIRVQTQWFMGKGVI